MFARKKYINGENAHLFYNLLLLYKFMYIINSFPDTFLTDIYIFYLYIIHSLFSR